MNSYSGAGAAIFKQIHGCSYVLLCKRRFHPFKGYWTFPGGEQERNESPLATAIRETHEKLGVSLNLQGRKVESSFIVHTSFFDWEIFFFEVDDLKISKKSAKVEFTNYKWVPVRSLHKYKLYPYVINVVLSYLCSKARSKLRTI